MHSRAALSLAFLLLATLAAYPARGGASPLPEPSNEALPESPAPATTSDFLWRAGSFRAAGQGFRGALYPSSAAAACDCQTAPSQPQNVAFTLTTYSSERGYMIDVPSIPGTPNPPIGSAHWTPEHLYSPLIGGFRRSQRKVDELFTGKLFGVPSNLRNVLHLGSASDR